MPDPESGVPTTIEAGNNYSFLLSYADYPVADYGLEFVIRSGSEAPKVIEATISGDEFLVTLTTLQTEDLPAGEATYAAYATDSGVRKTAENGTIQIIGNLARARVVTYAQEQLEHWQTQYSLMTRQLQSASSVIQSTSFQPDKIKAQIEHWQAVVAIEAKREQLARA